MNFVRYFPAPISHPAPDNFLGFSDLHTVSVNIRFIHHLEWWMGIAISTQMLEHLYFMPICFSPWSGLTGRYCGSIEIGGGLR